MHYYNSLQILLSVFPKYTIGLIFVPSENCDHRSGLQKLWSRRYFTSSSQDIGISFQSAITTPQLTLIGYGTATAQSWVPTSACSFYTQHQRKPLVGFRANYMYIYCTMNNVHKWLSQVYISMAVCTVGVETLANIHVLPRFSLKFIHM